MLCLADNKLLLVSSLALSRTLSIGHAASCCNEKCSHFVEREGAGYHFCGLRPHVSRAARRNIADCRNVHITVDFHPRMLSGGQRKSESGSEIKSRGFL